ncbi:MAG: flagellar hook-length control protein FliK [Lachnospiraceae bacterium]|nr:flagellar hook-length control protein FliK [Lachnospiraceae bacterium]
MGFLGNISEIGNYIHTGFGRHNTSGVDQGAENARVSDNGSGSSPQYALKGGDIVSGEVVEVDGNNVKLKLSNDILIDARLDGSVEVNKGQSMSFEVKSEGGQTALRPLYANLLSATPQAYQALSNAGLQATNANIVMVNSMMQEGMSVNREALYAMFKDVSANPLADPQTIVQLNKLNLPITDTNISQLENYKNLEYQIVDDAKTLTDGLSEMIRDGVTDKMTADILSLVSSDESEFAAALKSELEALTGLPADQSGQTQGIAAGEDGQPVNVSVLGQAENAEKTENAGGDFLAELKGIMKNAGNITAMETEGELLSTGKDIKAADPSVPADPNMIAASAEGAKKNAPISEPFNGQIAYPDTYEGALKELSDKLSLMGMDEDTASKIAGDKLAPSEMMQLVNELTKEISSGNEKFSPLSGALDRLLKTDGFRDKFKDALMEKFTISPKDVSGDGNINELYKRLLNQSEKIIDILNNAGKNESAIMNSAQNIRDNVSFMNDLNQMLQYVQLPLKMAQENAHGDLYVYTKKKNLMNKDGNVSALLHLDMENLGPMDVYVAMQNNRVNTHFYMQDDDTLDFVMQNIDRLDERLKAKGYDMHTTVTTKDIREDKGIVDKFLENASEDGSVSRIVSQFAFDVRA